MLVKHGVVPEMHEVACEVHCGVTFNADSCIMERHSCFTLLVQCAEGMILGVGECLFLLIAVVVARVEALLRVALACAHVKQRVVARVPPSVADVETPDKSYLLIDYHQLSMVAP